MRDIIERSVRIAAPIDTVWSAVIDHHKFGAWFGVRLEQPFVVGEPSTGHMTHPGYEHIRWSAEIVAIDPPSRFAFRWHPFAIDPDQDYADEPTTLVEFNLATDGDGTRLTVVESGFDALPAERRDRAFRSNSGGWDQQMVNIQAYCDR